jgi:hypothetical protein
VIGSCEGDDVTMRFDPRDFMGGGLTGGEPAPLRRPAFLAIVSSNTLAATMLRKANGRVDGLVIETRTAGGHNAPPRGKPQLNPRGEPVYGERDAIDLEKIRELGSPFWLAGGYGSAAKLREALELGAAGVQVGTAFAFTRESGLREDLKQALLEKAQRGEAQVFTDPLASPAGFPFKVACLEGTCSEEAVAAARPRICDLGFLREMYRGEDGRIAYRCPAEPRSTYLAKGGKAEDAEGRIVPLQRADGQHRSSAGAVWASRRAAAGDGGGRSDGGWAFSARGQHELRRSRCARRAAGGAIADFSQPERVKRPPIWEGAGLKGNVHAEALWPEHWRTPRNLLQGPTASRYWCAMIREI